VSEEDDDGDDDEEVCHDVTEASREKPRNLPASVYPRSDVTKPSTDAPGHQETPAVQFGTRKKSVPSFASDAFHVYRIIHHVSKKLCQCYFLNNSVKHWPILIIFWLAASEKYLT